MKNSFRTIDDDLLNAKHSRLMSLNYLSLSKISWKYFRKHCLTISIRMIKSSILLILKKTKYLNQNRFIICRKTNSQRYENILRIRKKRNEFVSQAFNVKFRYCLWKNLMKIYDYTWIIVNWSRRVEYSTRLLTIRF